MRYHLIPCCFFIGLMTQLGYGQQTTLDSLQQALIQAKSVKQEIIILNSIAQAYANVRPTTQSKPGINYAQKALKLAQKENMLPEIAQNKNILGALYITTKAYAKARKNLQAAWTIFKNKEDVRGQAKNLYYQGNLLVAQDKFEPALQLYQQALVLVDEAINQNTGNEKRQAQRLKASIFTFMGKTHYNLKDFPKALPFYQKALDIYTILGMKLQMARMHSSFSQVHQNMGNFSLNIRHIKAGRKLAEEVKELSLQSTFYHNEARNYEEQSEYLEAFRLYKKSLAIDQKLNDKEGQAITLNSLGNIRYRQNKYKEALELYQQSVAIAKAIKMGYIERHVQGNIINIYFYQKKYTKALEGYQQTLQAYKKAGNKQGIAGMLESIGGVYQAQGKYTLALKSLEQAYQIFETIQDKYNIANTANALSKNLWLTKDYKQAEAYVVRALDIAKKLKLKEMLVESYHMQYLIDSTQQNFADALAHHYDYWQLKDSIDNIAKTKQLEILRIKHGLDEKEQALAAKTKEAGLLAQKSQDNRLRLKFFLAGGVIVLLLVVVLIFGISQRKQRLVQTLQVKEVQEQLLQEQLHRKEIEEQILQEQLQLDQYEQQKVRDNLEDKDFELTKQALYLIQKTQFLEKVSNDLKGIAKASTETTREQLKGVIKNIKKETTATNEWQRFTQTFEIAHPGFYKRLQRKFSDLTEYDLKLCALLRLGFDSKELASILSIAPDSVKKARSRLRKKLNLTDEALAEFMREV